MKTKDSMYSAYQRNTYYDHNGNLQLTLEQPRKDFYGLI